MASERSDGNCLAWAARDPSGFLSPYKFSRRHVERTVSTLDFSNSSPWLSFSLNPSFDFPGLLEVMMFH